ncbi:HesA/MoeB/ThiF family protein [Methanobacterium aggregans]|uniref:HesA/MoeB/ThiF family protein n=1 Tax=Methanobacterium aggregans TaxID=1615586 RepID=UPI001AE4748A|nr:HesA/MoeB/ThiF family protein [Methanobacterium aggregans]MBP2046982.1 molybdopterin/thiamine biosynthesis adenylyltransferase [Methanobacterium aggregans]
MIGTYPEENYWEIIDRQKGILNKKEQLKLKNSKITVIGCGGIGGAVIEMLARMGVGNLRIIDKDVFDLSNINRQLMSSMDSIGKAKVDVTKETVNSINPFVKVEALNQELNEKNVETIVKNSDVVVDALDNLIARILTTRKAAELEIPFVHGAIHGTMGQVTTFTPDSPSYEETFKLPSAGKELTEEVIESVGKINKDVPPVIGPVPNVVGCLQAFEAVKYITGNGNIITAPNVLIFDLMKKEPFTMVEF